MARVNIMLPDDLLAQIDQVAAEEGVNRSKLLRMAVLAYFAARRQRQNEERRRADIGRAMEIQDHLRRTALSWDPLQLLRRQRQRV